MRLRALVQSILVVSLLATVAGCSGGTETITGTGAPGAGNADDPSGSAHGTKSDPEEASGTKPVSPGTGGDDPDDSDTDGPNGPAADVDGVIEIPQATGVSISADFVLSQSKKSKRIEIGTSDVACPVILSSTAAPYVYVELKNNGAKRALMSVWTAAAGSGLSNTADALAVYPGATPPPTDAARQECLGKATWSCSASPCTGWPGLASSAGDAVEVPANGSVIVFVQGETTKTGSFKLNVRTDFLQ